VDDWGFIAKPLHATCSEESRNQCQIATRIRAIEASDPLFLEMPPRSTLLYICHVYAAVGVRCKATGIVDLGPLVAVATSENTLFFPLIKLYSFKSLGRDKADIFACEGERRVVEKRPRLLTPRALFKSILL
ncbi:unnamed protein product, partial [Ectocarpus sp. 8 AP-2014]